MAKQAGRNPYDYVGGNGAVKDAVAVLADLQQKFNALVQLYNADKTSGADAAPSKLQVPGYTKP